MVSMQKASGILIKNVQNVTDLSPHEDIIMVLYNHLSQRDASFILDFLYNARTEKKTLCSS